MHTRPQCKVRRWEHPRPLTLHSETYLLTVAAVGIGGLTSVGTGIVVVGLDDADTAINGVRDVVAYADVLLAVFIVNVQ